MMIRRWRNVTMVLALAVVMACGQSSAVANTTVASVSALKDALAAAGGGEVILLTQGDYGRVYLSNYQFDAPVTVRAADRTDPPVLSFLKPSNLKNVVFDGLVFTAGDTVADDSYYALVDVYPCEGLVFTHCRFVGGTIETGDKAGYGSGFGLKVRSSTNTTIRRCVFTNLNKCVSTGEEDGLILEQNVAYDFRSDYFYVGGANIVIADNLALDCRPYTLPDGQGDHSDMVQLTGIRNSVIRDNFFRGSGQGIFGSGSNSGWDASITPGYNQIVNNIVYGGTYNMISVGGLPNSIIAHNVALSLHGDDDPFARLTVGTASAGAVIEYNISETVTINTADGAIANYNFEVQRNNPDNADYYGDVFVDALADEHATIAGFGLLPDVYAGLPELPGVDLGEMFWLSAGDPSDPANELYPVWLQLDEIGRTKLMEAIGLSRGQPGDADGDGDVDLADFVILKANFGASPLVDARADFDGDGDVDLNDFVILKTNFGA